MFDGWPDWAGESAVIVASGPSAASAPIDLARGKARVVVVNSSWRLAPWADVLVAADAKWWEMSDGWQDLPALKVTVDRRAASELGLRHAHAMRPDDRIYMDKVGTVGWGGNSGFVALNLTVQFGARRIALVGFDMQVDGGIHWHGPHPEGMGNPKAAKVGRWRRAMENAAKSLPDGVDVVNCSAASALTKYRKQELSEWLAS